MTFAPIQNRLGVQPVGTTVTCVNKSGTSVAIGDLVITSFIHAGAVVNPEQAANTSYVFNCIRKAVSTETGNTGYLGVVTGLMTGAGDNGREVQVQFGGICQAKVVVNATVTSGTLLGVSNTAGVLSNAVSTSNYSVTLMDNAAVADGTALKRVYIPTEYSFNGRDIVYNSGLQSFMDVETVSGSSLVGTAVARALRGEQSLTILIDGDSNENIGASGYMSRGARNFSLLAAQDAGLVRSGFIPCYGIAGIYTAVMPVRAIGTNGAIITLDLDIIASGKLAALTPKLPAAWLNASANPIYVAPSTTATNGIIAGLQAFGTNIDPKYGVGAGPETPWWNRTEGETYCDVYCLRCNETGFGAEIIVRVTPTDTLQGAITPAPALVTYTSGSGGIPAANLTSEDIANGTVVVVRVPVTFNNGGLKNCAQININGSGGKVAVCGVEFVRPNAKGLSFSVVSGRSGYKLANYVNDHAAAGPVYKVFADRIRADGGEVAYLPQACVNDAYVQNNYPKSTATEYKAIVQSRIAQVRQSSWLGANTPIILVAAPYRDSGTDNADAQDAAYDQYPSALRDIATQNTSGIIALNARKYLHKLGLNRGSETVYYNGSVMTFPSSARGGGVGGQEGVDQWRLNALNPVTPLVNYSYLAGTIVSFPSLGTMLCTANVANEHPVAGGGANYTKWQARRQWLSYAAPTVTEPLKTANDSITNGTNLINMDNVHFGGAGMFKIRMAETTLILQAAAMLR